MNRRQRRAHRITWALLAPLLVLTVAGAIAFRRAFPVGEAGARRVAATVRP